jgi:hypothetical protein
LRTTSPSAVFVPGVNSQTFMVKFSELILSVSSAEFTSSGKDIKLIQRRSIHFFNMKIAFKIKTVNLSK